jgi:hypothetical protein
MVGVPSLTVERDARDHESDAGDVLGGWHLAEHDRADDRGEHGQQREHERERGTGQAGHRQLIHDVGDDRGADAHSRPGEQQQRPPERGQGLAKAERSHGHQRDQHRRSEHVELPAGVRHAVADDHVQHEQCAVTEGEHEAEGLAGQADRGNGGDTDDSQGQGSRVAPGPRPGRGQDHGAEELDGAYCRQRQPVDGEVEQ